MAKQMTLCLGQQLSQRLHELAELEGRHVKHQAVFLLEVMAVLAKRFPKLQIESCPEEETVAKLSFAISLSDELEDHLFHLGGSYGLKRQNLMRALLWMGMEFHQRLVPKGRLINKEVLIELILEKIRPPAWVN